MAGVCGGQRLRAGPQQRTAALPSAGRGGPGVQGAGSTARSLHTPAPAARHGRLSTARAEQAGSHCRLQGTRLPASPRCRR